MGKEAKTGQRAVRLPVDLLERAKAASSAVRTDAKVRAAGARLSTAGTVRLLLLRGLDAVESEAKRKAAKTPPAPVPTPEAVPASEW
jgi:hypothetical protein